MDGCRCGGGLSVLMLLLRLGMVLILTHGDEDLKSWQFVKILSWIQLWEREDSGLISS